MYQVRFAHQSDLPWMDQAVAAGAWESLAPEERPLVHPLAAAQHGQSQLRWVLSTPGSIALVAQAGARPVGYLLLSIGPDSSTEEPTAHLIDLWIDPHHRRRGVGTGLLTQAERWIAAQGLRKVKLWTGLHNQAVVAFAEKHGFSPAGLIGVKDL
jgi:ribosomal protein S18 acetylase RimI-like enzyme